MKKKILTTEEPIKKLAWLLLNDSKTISAVIGSLKRTFSRSPIIKCFLDKHRIEKPYYKKDGSKSSISRVFYKCSKCSNEFPASQINVDHIDPVIPLNIPVKHMSLDIIVKRLFCDEKNLQILCKKDHKEKSIEENKIRNEWLLKTKYIVYETTNSINHKKYIGVHKCDDYDDVYLGSGNLLKLALKKYGRDSFYRTILFVFDNPNEALDKEREIVNNKIVESDDYYNIQVGGQGKLSGKHDTSIRIICHQTKEEFNSISELADILCVSGGHVSTHIDKNNHPLKNLHYFKKETYNPNVQVSYPLPKRYKGIICLNNYTIYNNMMEASNKLGLCYKAFNKAFKESDENNIRSLLDYKFVYIDDFEIGKEYYVDKTYIRCIETNTIFTNVAEAAKSLPRKYSETTMCAIYRAIRTGGKMYGYHWDRIVKRHTFDTSILTEKITDFREKVKSDIELLV